MPLARSMGSQNMSPRFAQVVETLTNQKIIIQLRVARKGSQAKYIHRLSFLRVVLYRKTVPSAMRAKTMRGIARVVVLITTKVMRKPIRTRHTSIITMYTQHLQSRGTLTLTSSRSYSTLNSYFKRESGSGGSSVSTDLGAFLPPTIAFTAPPIIFILFKII